MKKSIIVFSLCTFLILTGLWMISGSTAIAADKVIKWQCQTMNPTGDSSFKRYEAMFDDLKKRTGGRLQVTLFGEGAIVPSKEIFNAVKRGMLPIGMNFPGYTRDAVPLNHFASGLPFNFKNVWEALYFNNILGFDKMMEDAHAAHGVMAFPVKVYPTMLVTKKPIKKFEDFKGMKLRASGTLQNYLSSIGAAASYLPGTELYAALATGVVQGAHWGGYTGAFDRGLYELAKYQFPVALNIASSEQFIINKKAVSKLPKDIQEMLPGFMREWFVRMTIDYMWIEEECKGRIGKDLGVKHEPFSEAEYAKMLKAALGFWDDVAKKSPGNAKAVKMLKDFHRSLHRDL